MSDVYIVGIGSISALGTDPSSVTKGYSTDDSFLRYVKFDEYDSPVAVGSLSETSQQQLSEFAQSHSAYDKLDKTVLMGLFAGQQALQQTQWTSDASVGVVLGSSRGATGNLEYYHQRFLENAKVDSACSPTTTLGNLSSWVAQQLNLFGPSSEISSTCSSSLYAIGMALAWLKAGFSDKFLAGGTEAPLTPFTIAQMKALRVYARGTQEAFPSRPCEKDTDGFDGNHFDPKLRTKKNMMVLGEGAGVVALECRQESCNLPKIMGAGFSVEPIKTRTSMSENGEGIYRAMKQALQRAAIDRPDVIITHTPGTSLGDRSELTAISRLFADHPPILTSNKWKIGHTLGASGVLSLEYALNILEHQRYCNYPYPAIHKNEQAVVSRMKTVMINSVGFGGNSGSLIISQDN